MLIGLGDDPWESEQASAWTPEATAAIKPKSTSWASDLWESIQSSAWTPAAMASLNAKPPGKMVFGVPVITAALLGLAVCGAGYYYMRGRS